MNSYKALIYRHLNFIFECSVNNKTLNVLGPRGQWTSCQWLTIAGGTCDVCEWAHGDTYHVRGSTQSAVAVGGTYQSECWQVILLLSTNLSVAIHVHLPYALWLYLYILTHTNLIPACYYTHARTHTHTGPMESLKYWLRATTTYPTSSTAAHSTQRTWMLWRNWRHTHAIVRAHTPGSSGSSFSIVTVV